MSNCAPAYVAYNDHPYSLDTAPVLVPSILPDGSHQDEYNLDLNGYQGMPHLTIAEELGPPLNEGLCIWQKNSLSH